MSSSTPRRRKPGCEHCRARHVKCEGGVPCSQCSKRGLSCHKAPRARFRRASIAGATQPDFPAQQTWCRTAGRQLDFVDQTLETTRSYHEGYHLEDDEAYAAGIDTRHIPRDVLPNTATPQSAEYEPAPDLMDTDTGPSCSPRGESFPAFQDETSGPSGSIVSPVSSTRNPPHESPGTSRHSVPASIATPAVSFGDTSSQGQPVPVISPESILQRTDELAISGFPQPAACSSLAAPGVPWLGASDPLLLGLDQRSLLQNFSRILGQTLDFCDPDRILAADVLEKALESPELLEILVTVSARHFHGDSSMHDELPGLLNALGSDTSHAATAALLLRLHQNLQDTTDDPRRVNYAVKLWEILNSPLGSSQYEDRFLQNICWAGLRQELFLAMTNQRTACINLDEFNLQNLSSSSDDEAWTNRIFLHLIDTVQFCFGETRSPAVYDQLVSYSLTWMRSKPPSFTPVYTQKRTSDRGNFFPELWFMSDFAAISSQYYHLVRILLIAYNPRTPQLGPAKRAAKRWINAQIRSDVKIVCGIAESRGDVNTSHLPACMAIAVAGDKFSDKEEQNALLAILAKTTHRYGWSTSTAQTDLQESWGSRN